MRSPWPRSGRGRAAAALVVAPLAAAALAFSSVPGVYGDARRSFTLVALFGTLFLVASLLVHLRVAPRVGRFTSVAALSVVWSVLFLAVALLSPSCPGTDDGVRCSTFEAGTWMLSGALMPIMWGVLLLPLGFLVRVVRGLLVRRRLRRLAAADAAKQPAGKQSSSKAAKQSSSKVSGSASSSKGAPSGEELAGSTGTGSQRGASQRRKASPGPRPVSKKRRRGPRR